MKRISKMLLLLLIVTAPVALFIIDNQSIMHDKTEVKTSVKKMSEDVAYSLYKLVK